MKSRKRQDKIWYYIFTGPTLFVFCTIVIIPFIIGIYYSFFSWDGMPLSPKLFVGLENYIRLFTDKRFLTSGLYTVQFTVVSVIVTNILGLFFALIVTTKLRVSNLARTMFFAPHLIGGLLLGFIWKFIFSDVFKVLGEMTGAESVLFNWLIDPKFAMLALVVVNAWRMAGYIMIIYIAGIQNIPTDVMEAASVDGAGYWAKLKNIMVPLLAPSFTITLFLTLSNAFKIYDVNLSLTNGGPFSSTELFAMNIYQEIFKANNYGYGQAKAILFFVFVAVISMAQTYFTKRKEVEM